MTEDKKEVQKDEEVSSAEVWLFFIGLITLLLVGFCLGRASKEDSQKQQQSTLLIPSAISSNLLSDKLQDVRYDVDAIIDNLPEKEKCRVEYESVKNNPRIFGLTLPVSCEKWLEKVPEHYKLP